jgi:hypothetical protein
MSFFDEAIWNGDSGFEDFLDGNEGQFSTGDTPQVDQSSIDDSADVALSSTKIGNEIITHSATGAVDNPPSESEPIPRDRNEQFALTNFNEASSHLQDEKLTKSAPEAPSDFSNEVQPTLVGLDEPSFATNFSDIGQNPSNLGGDGSSANTGVTKPLQDLGPLLLDPDMSSRQPQNIENVLDNQSQEYGTDLTFEEDEQESILLANEMFLEQTTSQVSHQDTSSTSSVNVNANEISSGEKPFERSSCSQSEGDSSNQPTLKVQRQAFLIKPTSHAQEELNTSPTTPLSSGITVHSRIQMNGGGKRKNEEGDGRVSKKKNIPKSTTVYGVCSMKDAFAFTSNYPHVELLPLHSYWNDQSRDLDVRRPQILQAVCKQDSHLPERLNGNLWNISTKNETLNNVQTGKSGIASGISMNVMYDQARQPHDQPINLSSAYTQISTLQQAISGNTDLVQSSPINQEQFDSTAEFAVEDQLQELPIDAQLYEPVPSQRSSLPITPPESPETETAKKASFEDKRFDLFLTEHREAELLELTESTDVSFTEMLAGAWNP